MAVYRKQIATIERQIKEIDELKNLVSTSTKNAIYTQQLCTIIMEELIRERVFSKEKVEIIGKRASIRSKEQIKHK